MEKRHKPREEAGGTCAACLRGLECDFQLEQYTVMVSVQSQEVGCGPDVEKAPLFSFS